MYSTISKDLRNYIEQTDDGILCTNEMPKELEEKFEKTKKNYQIHDEMVNVWKGKI